MIINSREIFRFQWDFAEEISIHCSKKSVSILGRNQTLWQYFCNSDLNENSKVFAFLPHVRPIRHIPMEQTQTCVICRQYFAFLYNSLFHTIKAALLYALHWQDNAKAHLKNGSIDYQMDDRRLANESNVTMTSQLQLSIILTSALESAHKIT